MPEIKRDIWALAGETLACVALWAPLGLHVHVPIWLRIAVWKFGPIYCHFVIFLVFLSIKYDIFFLLPSWDILVKKHFAIKGNFFATLCKPKSNFLIFGCGRYCLFYVDIFIQFLGGEILPYWVCESLCFDRHISDLDLLEEFPPLFSSRYTVDSSIYSVWLYGCTAAARSGLHSPLSAYCSSGTCLNPCENNSPVTWAAYLLGRWFVSQTASAPLTLDPVNTTHVCIPAELGVCHESDRAFARARHWSWLIALCLSVKILAAGFFFCHQTIVHKCFGYSAICNVCLSKKEQFY